MTMDYESALQYLYSQLPMFSRVGAAAYKPGLDTSIAIDNHFGNPHRKFRAIHIGGTNGKGSTSHMLASVLQAHGYKVGLYTSPHLVDFRERIRVNGEMIPQEDVVDFVERYKASGYEGHPSFFELTMMMAFDWFAKSECDYCVIEVGMGGRLDSTNIITPLASVITNISWDHIQFLGDTLPKIAGEKAGIIKSGIPVVIGEAEGDVRKVFEERAREVDTKIEFAEDRPRLLAASPEKDGWVCTTTLLPDHELRVSLRGEYQKKNINTVLAAIEMLRNAGIEISDRDMIEGLGNVERLTGLRGRWTRLADRPLTICDTGHNEAGLTYNMQQLQDIMRERPEAKLHIVMGFVSDKAVDHILPLFPKDAIYYLTQASIPRAMPVDTLAEICHRNGIIGKTFSTVAEAYDAAISNAEEDDVVYVGGSTFVVADLLAKLDKNN